ncbi:MAG: hypothetical protein HQL39_10830 [Alphaproteobacteria bacterium]|nr:hypothetical protein [Alphaproteobacteria bacterium]
MRLAALVTLLLLAAPAAAEEATPPPFSATRFRAELRGHEMISPGPGALAPVGRVLGEVVARPAGNRLAANATALTEQTVDTLWALALWLPLWWLGLAQPATACPPPPPSAPLS